MYVTLPYDTIKTMGLFFSSIFMYRSKGEGVQPPPPLDKMFMKQIKKYIVKQNTL